MFSGKHSDQLNNCEKRPQRHRNEGRNMEQSGVNIRVKVLLTSHSAEQ